MSGFAGTVPVLRVRSREIEDPGPLENLLQPDAPLVLVRNGNGAVGFLERHRMEFTGPSRFEDAAAAWRKLVDASIVEEALDIPGSGLVAAGSFTFSAASSSTSKLIVPSVVIGRRGGRAWVTTIDDAARPDPTPFGAPFSVRFDSHTGEQFVEAVTAAVARIATSGLRKVVLARTIRGSLPPGADLRLPIAALARAYPDALTFAVDGLIGASPETLVRVEGNRVTARVLAGTAARGVDVAADSLAQGSLLSSAKDLGEHDFARRSVIDALGPHSADLAAGEPFVLELPNLLHIASDVQGSLADGSSALDLVAALHPTAAVAGTPTSSALAAIAELETFDRGRYAGPVGWVGADGDGEWAVALRCAQVGDDGTVTAYAGAGIVVDSVPEQELAETDLKFRPILDAFGG